MQCTTKLLRMLDIEAVSAPAFMDTIHSMHPIVKSMLDDVCETAKQEIKDKKEDELGSWKRNRRRWHVANTWLA